MDDVVAVSARGYHTAAIKANGSLWTWGSNHFGQLGDGTTEHKYTPVKIMDNVAAVSAGSAHTAAIKTDGSLWTWGDNPYGELGDGTTEYKYSPVKIMDDVVAVSAGTCHTAAIKKDGSLWTWGANSFGELGDGTTEDKHSPVKVMDGVRLPNSGGFTATPTTPEPVGKMQILTNAPSLSVTLGHSFIVGAKPENGDLSGISFTVEDKHIISSGTVSEKDGALLCSFTAKQAGTSKIKVNNSKTGETAELAFTVVPMVGNAYVVNNVPRLVTDKNLEHITNFYNFHGLYVDNYKYSPTNKGTDVSFTVYNTKHYYGTVEVYDADGNFIEGTAIDKCAYETGLSDAWDSMVSFAGDIWNRKLLDYRSASVSVPTEVAFNIPKGGYMCITSDARVSSVCGIVNAIDLLIQSSEFVDKVKNKDKDAVAKTVMEHLKKTGKDYLSEFQSNLSKEYNKEIHGSVKGLKSYLSVLKKMFKSGKLKELMTDVAADSAIGVGEGEVISLLSSGENPAGGALEFFFTQSKIENLIMQAIQTIQGINKGSITIQNPDGNVRSCSDVTLKCNVSSNTALDVYRIDKNDSKLGELKKQHPEASGNNTQVVAYEINLIENGKIVQPKKATVTIALPADMQGKTGKVTVYREEPGGKITKLDGISNGYNVTFETDHFSTYFVAMETTDNSVPETEEGQVVVEGNTIVSDWAEKEITEAFNEELVPAVLIGEDLTKQVDRAEFAAIAVSLYENLSGKSATAAANPFGDISGNYCEDEILKAYALNITNGTSAVSYEPSTLISREQVATMLTRAYKKSEWADWSLANDNGYSLNSDGVKKFADDNEISDWAKGSVYFMAKWNIIKGVDDTHFAPKANVNLGESYGFATREQAVVIALRSAKYLKD